LTSEEEKAAAADRVIARIVNTKGAVIIRATKPKECKECNDVRELREGYCFICLGPYLKAAEERARAKVGN